MTHSSRDKSKSPQCRMDECTGILLYDALCTIMECDRKNHEAGTMSYSYFEWLQGFSCTLHSTMGNIVHLWPLNSLEHYICTTTMTNIRPDRDANLVPLAGPAPPCGELWLCVTLLDSGFDPWVFVYLVQNRQCLRSKPVSRDWCHGLSFYLPRA